MSFADPDYVAVILDSILQTVAAGLAVAGRPVDRVTRTPGPAARYCGLLAAWPQIRVVSPETRTDARAIRRHFRLALDVNLLLTRCLASAAANDIPTAEQVDSDGAGFATDMFVMTRTLAVGAADSTLLPGGCNIAHLNPVVPARPGGGLSGITTTMEVTLG